MEERIKNSTDDDVSKKLKFGLYSNLKDLDKKISISQAKRDSLYSRLASAENAKVEYRNTRDLIADKIIARYDEKISPIENRLTSLENTKRGIDFRIYAADLSLSKSLEKLKKEEAQIQQEKVVLDAAGLGTGSLDVVLESLRGESRQIEKEKRKIQEDLFAVNKRVANADRAANALKDRRNNFIRMKEGVVHLPVEGNRNTLNNSSSDHRTNPHSQNQASTPDSLDNRYIVSTPSSNRTQSNEGKNTQTQSSTPESSPNKTARDLSRSWFDFIKSNNSMNEELKKILSFESSQNNNQNPFFTLLDSANLSHLEFTREDFFVLLQKSYVTLKNTSPELINEDIKKGFIAYLENN